MRKKLCILLGMAMLLQLCACGRGNAEVGDPRPDMPVIVDPAPSGDPGDVQIDTELTEDPVGTGEPEPSEEPAEDPTEDPGNLEPVVDYIGPDGRDHRLAMLGEQSMLYKGCRILDLEYETHRGNLMLSPLSIWMAMGMAASGADGTCLEDMESFLGAPIGEFNSYASDLMSAASENRKVRLRVANGAWFKDTIATIDPDFKSVVEGTYKGQAKGCAMDKATVDEINAFVSKNTNKMIPSILESMPIDAIAMLVDALYFDAPWMEAYEQYQVSDGTFHSLDGDVDATFMDSVEGSYMEDERFEAFRKPYMDGYSFIGILPKQEGEFWLGDVDFEGLFASETGEYDVRVKMPKFEFESSMEVGKIMQQMGLATPFSRETADFSGMMSNCSKAIWISHVLHKTRIEVTETGTKAAAATAVSMVTDSAIMEVPEFKDVVLDRPFAFVILDKDGETPLFVGKVMAP